MLVNEQWQEVPGAAGLRMFPILSRGIATSNALVIAAEDAVVVIDPGGTAEQGRKLAGLLAGCAGDRPVTALLTHAHRDHFAALDEIERPVTLIAHAAAAAALKTGDQVSTLAEFNGGSFRPRALDVHLFQTDRFPVVPPLVTGCGDHWPRHRLRVGRQFVDVLAAPGHSRCSVVFRVGDLLLLGDIPFAANPGVVGIGGWNQADLRRSTHRLQWLLATEPDLICLSGHGTSAVTGQVTARQLEGLLTEIGRLDRVAVLDGARVAELQNFGAELLAEVCRLFTMLAARQAMVSFYLEDLEEQDQADQVRATIDAVAIERILDDVACGYRDFRAGRQVNLVLLMKAASRMQRVAHLIGKSHDQPGICVRLAGGVERLLAGFSNAMVGLMPNGDWEEFDVGALVTEVVALDQDDGSRDDEIIDALEGKTRFAAALANRLAGGTPLWNPQIECALEGALMLVEGDRQLLADAFTTVIELVSSASMENRVRIVARQVDERVIIAVQGDGVVVAQALDTHAINLWARLLAYQQTSLHCERTTVTIESALGREPTNGFAGAA